MEQIRALVIHENRPPSVSKAPRRLHVDVTTAALGFGTGRLAGNLLFILDECLGSRVEGRRVR
jgi:hypothetical protein